jgi:16S rRNA (cytidine1402-2'-O)-methyltransferase
MLGKLYIVATPIGHLADMTPRAVEVLKTVDIIAAEDTRHSRPLLNHFSVDTPVVAYHEHNEAEQAENLVQKLKRGQSVALISDAGTPLISDPGYSLVNLAIEHNITIEPIPGVSALITALSASGLPTDSFYFAGFLPSKTGARVKRLTECQSLRCTSIFYESCHRILASLADMQSVFSAQRPCVVGRELTKKFETFYYGSLAEVTMQLEANKEQQKGEFVVLIHGVKDVASEQVSAEGERVFELLRQQLPPKKAAKLTAAITGDKASVIYDGLIKSV